MQTPAYLSNNPAAAPMSYLQQLPGMFNTAGLQRSYANAENQNWNSGSALAAAAANQYVQRANQSGASTLGAGFAQASAMLPVYQQNAQMNDDLQNKILQYRSQQGQIGAGLAGDIGRLQSQYQGTLSDYFLNQQKLQQQQSEFGQTFGLQQQQLAQQGAQYGAQNRLNALRLSQTQPTPGYTYQTNLFGDPVSAQDAQQKNLADAYSTRYTGQQNALQNFF